MSFLHLEPEILKHLHTSPPHHRQGPAELGLHVWDDTAYDALAGCLCVPAPAPTPEWFVPAGREEAHRQWLLDRAAQPLRSPKPSMAAPGAAIAAADGGIAACAANGIGGSPLTGDAFAQLPTTADIAAATAALSASLETAPAQIEAAGGSALAPLQLPSHRCPPPEGEPSAAQPILAPLPIPPPMPPLIPRDETAPGRLVPSGDGERAKDSHRERDPKPSHHSRRDWQRGASRDAPRSAGSSRDPNREWGVYREPQRGASRYRDRDGHRSYNDDRHDDRYYSRYGDRHDGRHYGRHDDRCDDRYDDRSCSCSDSRIEDRYCDRDRRRHSDRDRLRDRDRDRERRRSTSPEYNNSLWRSRHTSHARSREPD